MQYNARADSEQMEKAAVIIDALLKETDAGMMPNANLGKNC